MTWRQKLGIASLVLGALIGGATWGTAVNHAVNPVPIADLGLTEETAAEMRQAVSALQPVGIVGADSDEDNAGKRIMLTAALYAANGNQWPWHGPQLIGDCPSFADMRVVAVDLAQRWQAGESDWEAIDPTWFYFGSRVRNGRVQISGDGGIPAWGLEFGRDKGILPARDAPPYTAVRAREWGRKGPPDDRYPIAAKYTIGMMAPVRSAQEACNFLAAGYPIAFGSMQWGTRTINLVEGRNVAVRNARWPHAQACVGYDGTTAKYGKRGLFRIDNSWGPEAHNPKSSMPGDAPGGYYVTWADFDSICQENMAVAISGTQGFEKRSLDFDVLKAVGAVAPNEQGEWIMFEIDAVTGYGMMAVLLAIGLYLLLGNVFRRHGRMLTAMAMLAMPCIQTVAEAGALDFGVLAKPSENVTPSSSRISSDCPLSFAVLSSPPAVESAQCPLNFGVLCSKHICADGCDCGDDCACTEKCECVTKTASAIVKPSVRPSAEAQKKLDAARAKPKADLSELTPRYPVRDSKTWWSHPGQRSKENIINHLMSGEHAGKFRRDMLERMTLAELESLHSDDHERKVKPIADAGKKMVPVYENRRVCNGGTCTTMKVFVGYRWE